MFEVSISVYLILYGIMVAIFVIFAIINLYHLFAFGFLSFQSFFMTFIFLGGTVLILFVTYKWGLKLDWSQTFII